MLIATHFAGFTFAEADLFRRAISKKHKDEILKMKEKFILGSINKGHDKDLAIKIFNAILKFANYGFNKSHAVSYAMITCKMAYLKANHPLEFYSSILTMEFSSSSTKILKYISEIKKMNIQIKTPSINYSYNYFIPYNNSILFPFSSIKNISNALIREIVKEREENGLYKSINDFIFRINKNENLLTEKQLSYLIDAGAFDEFSNNRKALKQNIPELINSILFQKEAGDLFNENQIIEHKIDSSIKDDPIERINNEINVLSFAISDNLLNHIKLDNNLKNKITLINNLKINKNTLILGIVKSFKSITIKKGKFKDKLMGFLSLEDSTSDIDIIVFPENYINYHDYFKNGNLLLIEGRLEKKDDKLSFILNKCKEMKIDE